MRRCGVDADTPLVAHDQNRQDGVLQGQIDHSVRAKAAS